MPTYKLYYFPGKGIAETTRMMFKLKDVPFEDIRLAGEKWLDFKPQTPFGQMPVLDVDGKLLCQSKAIQRYVAKALGLNGNDEWEMAQVDMMVDICDDLKEGAFQGYRKTEEEKAAIYKEFLTEKAPVILDKVEALLQATGYCVGNQITLADIQFYNMIELSAGQGCKLPIDAAKHPKIKLMLENVETNPKIAAWIKERPDSKF